MNHIKDLRPDKKNARRHNPRNIGMIERALNEVGAARSIVIDEDNNILAGNGTIEAASSAGIENVQIVEADGNTIIAVRRRGLTPEQKQRLALYDNRTAELAEWDTTVLADIIAKDEAMVEGMFQKDEIDALLADVAPGGGNPADDPGAQVDKAEELRQKWQTATGQIWQLGDHRLACGDCRDAALVERLMGGEKASIIATDPPYRLIGGGSQGDYFTGGYMEKGQGFIDKGKSRLFEVPEFSEWMPSLDFVAAPDVEAFIMSNDRNLVDMLMVLQENGWKHHNLLVWNKNIMVRHDWYMKNCEFIIYIYKGRALKPINLGRGMIIDIPVKAKEKEHVSQKPVELLEYILENHKGEIVYEPFSGSGTTLIACERLGRRCWAVEIDPGYCAVTLQRWADMTGGQPEKIEG